MLIDLGNSNYSIYALLSDTPIKLEGVDKWIKSLKYQGGTSCKNSTIKSYIQKLEKFFYWTLTNQVLDDEDLFDYFLRFKHDSINGIVIKKEFIIDNTLYYKDVLKIGPMQESTFDTYEAAIYSFFGVTNKKSSYALYTEEDNYAYKKYLETYGKLSSLNVKISKYDEYKQKKSTGRKRKNNDFRGFPIELFDELLEMSSRNDKLIFLLSGATSARIGQVLNLTMNDINFENKEVRLIDPHSDEIDDYKKNRKRWLLDRFNIDMDTNNEHNEADLQFKSRIPTTHIYLFWLHEEKYKNIFFKEIALHMRHGYISLNEKKHPFVFTTKTGKRYRYNYAYKNFKKHCEVLSNKYPKYKNILKELGVHSLRHMFGHFLAEYSVSSNDESIIFSTAEAMGHSNIFSTLIYFKLNSKTIQKNLNEASQNIGKPTTVKKHKLTILNASKLYNTKRNFA